MLKVGPNFNELFAFVQVAEAGGFSKAASRLGVTPSALSQNIGNLERQLGLRLFNRTTRSISLTEAGERLLADIGPHFQAVAEGVSRLDQLHDVPQGTIRINTSEFAAELILYPKLKPFMWENPQVNLEIMVENRWVDIVEQGFDMGVRLGYALYDDMVAIKISEPVRMALLASPEYLSGSPAIRGLADLNRHRLIGTCLSNAHSKMDWEFVERGRKVAFQPKCNFLTNGSLRRRAALDGLGIAWLPEVSVRTDLDSGALVEVLPEMAMTYDPLYLYYPSRKGHSLAFREVVDLLRV